MQILLDLSTILPARSASLIPSPRSMTLILYWWQRVVERVRNVTMQLELRDVAEGFAVFA
jgi:hypothetical protein